MGFIHFEFERKATSPDDGQRIPDSARLSGSNGVELPGPMKSGFEDGFRAEGALMDGVRSFSGNIVGVQLDGGPDEDGWDFGENLAGLASRQQEPPTNQHFGVESGMTPAADEDDEVETRVFGTVGSNTAGVLTSDILRVFDAIATNGRDRGDNGAGSVPGHDAMRGIPLGAGSGPVGRFEQSSDSTGGSGSRNVVEANFEKPSIYSHTDE